MDEYINRESAIRALLNDAPEQVGYSREDAADCIRYMDVADVAPVVHGQWLRSDDDWDSLTPIRCSICGEEWYFEMIDDVTLLNYKYCPNCGARMDGED